MPGTYNNLTLIIRENPGSEYKYLIRTKYAQGYTAYRTQKGFMDFMKRSNLKIKFVEKYHNKEYGKILIYNLIGEVKDLLFWKMSELPEGVIKFKGLCNGSYVDCYYIHNENGSTVYRPNPNAKEVYNPLTLAEHIKLNKVIG